MDDESRLDRTLKKLIEAKQGWARSGRLLTGTAADHDAVRLPPGQRLVKNWPVLDLGVKPEIRTERWSLAIDGAVAVPQKLDWAAFNALPRREMVSDIHCVTAWSRYDNRWQGVSTADLLELVQPTAEARHVLFESYDGYTTNVTLDAFRADDALLAHSWEGKPLTVEHGGPLRVVIPRYYFWKSAKWIKRITFSPVDRPGFWEVRGYHNEGDPWTEERYS